MTLLSEDAQPHGRRHQTVELLLEKLRFDCIEESLRYAISKGNTKIVRAIVEHPSYIAEERQSALARSGRTARGHPSYIAGGADQERARRRQRDPFFRTDEKSQFSPDITPLILAAHYNNHELIQPRPHPTTS